MNYLSLATRYRPQTFAAVAGQPLAATALSRAAATDKVAPAYLLSGTRGVGKTTIARIFAKALNCEHAPTAEPCNECAQCQHITAGNHVDVNEIDGASNTSVDDVRALRETIGFLPMEGRYKIYIIDEAHMLSKSAFNALLKTLEEPPAHTVFIFATTEVHRFPPTIISRCQHFVFRHLSEEAIYNHLSHILGLEKIQFEEAAVRLLARRAAGSVRDSLSLLDQVLAVAGETLTSATVREALGVAGPELFDQLLDAISGQDMAQIMELAGGLLRSGVDMGFFTRELGSIWRNLFLLRQAGEKILPGIANITDDEKEFLRRHAARLTAAHLHAAWQMTLESQRTIAQSPEPGAALELLLLNLALLPQLLPVGSVTPESAQGLAEAPSKSYGSTVANVQLQTRAPVEVAPQVPVQTPPEAGVASHSWSGFCEFCRKEQEAGRDAPPQNILRGVQCDWQGNALELKLASESLANQIEGHKPLLQSMLAHYCGGKCPELTWLRPRPARSSKELEAECGNDPRLKLCTQILDAEIRSFEDKQNIQKE